MSATAVLSAGCGLLAHAVLRRTAPECEDLRRAPGPTIVGGEPIAAGTLKHLDEQTLIVLEAVAAVRRQLGDTESWADWGVVAAPCYLGRAILVPTVNRFRAEGAWGVSPHIVPHRSLHSISGTVSQVYKIHGPNYGVGGGPEHIVEGLSSALPLLDALDLPGVLLILSRVVPQLDPTRKGRLNDAQNVDVVVLALVPEDHPDSVRRVALELPMGQADPSFTFERLVALLESDEPVDTCAKSSRLLRLDRPHGRPAAPHAGRLAGRLGYDLPSAEKLS